MRLMIKFKPLNNAKYTDITNIELQGFVYSLLKNTRYHNKHDENGFKFFCFSNIYPPTDYVFGDVKHLIISSISTKLIKTIYHRLKTFDYVKIKNIRFKIIKIIKYDDNLVSECETSTPIVLYENKKEDKYFSFKKNKDYDFFFKRLEDNLAKKYNAYYDDDLELNDVFVNYEFKKEVAHSLKHKNYKFIIIGSQWRNLTLNPDVDKKIYKFMYEVGLGEKNSLGYGFINQRRRQ